MRIAELFAGSGSIRKACDQINAESIAQGGPVIFQVWSTDWVAFEGVDHVGDVLELSLEELPWPPDFIWASVPCTTYSLLAIGRHRVGPRAKTEAAALGDRIVLHTLELIRQAQCGWMIENPRAMLRKMPFMKGLDRRTVCYCRYGDTVMKPTDLWSNCHRSLLNIEGWDPRPMCHNNNKHCHHERAPRYTTLKARGMVRTGGTTMKADVYTRSQIPHDLCVEVMRAAARMYQMKVGPWHQHTPAPCNQP